MEKKVNFIIIGIFITSLVATIIFIVFWLGNYANDKDFKFYKINTTSSVSGLNIQAPVKFRGVEIGQVSDIFINPKNSEEVSIIIKIDPTTPIKEDTYALIEPQGITGLSYLQLEGGTNNSKMLQTSLDNMGVIISKHGTLAQIGQSVKSITHKTDQTLELLSKLASEKNIKNIEVILENMAVTSQNFAEFSKILQKYKKDIRYVIENAKEVENKMIEAAKNVSSASAKMESGAEQFRDMFLTMNDKLNSGAFDLKIVMKEFLNSFKNTLHEIDIFFQKSEKMVDELQKSPSDVIFKSSQTKPGPGENQ